MVKNLPANAGDARDLGSIPGLRRSPGCRKWQPTPVFLSGKLHGLTWRLLKKLGMKAPYDPAVPLQADTLRKPKLKKTHVSHCSLQHCLQKLEHGSNLDVHLQMIG